jgi:hypothetical protein
MKTWIASLATLAAAVGLVPSPARADHLSDIDELACLLRDQAAAAAREIRYHFVSAPNYRHLYSDVYELYRGADQVHELIHRRASLAQVSTAVDELDDLFHHVEDQFDELERCGWSGHVDLRHSHHGYREARLGYGSRNSYHLRRLKVRVAAMGDTIHDLGDEIHAHRGPGRVGPALPPVPPESLPHTPPSFDRRPVAPVGPTFPSAGRSIRFGKKDGLSFTLHLAR